MMNLQLVHVSLYPISKQARLIENKWCIHMQPAQLVLACSEPPIYLIPSGQMQFLMKKFTLLIKVKSLICQNTLTIFTVDIRIRFCHCCH